MNSICSYRYGVTKMTFEDILDHELSKEPDVLPNIDAVRVMNTLNKLALGERVKLSENSHLYMDSKLRIVFFHHCSHLTIRYEVLSLRQLLVFLDNKEDVND